MLPGRIVKLMMFPRSLEIIVRTTRQSEAPDFGKMVVEVLYHPDRPQDALESLLVVGGANRERLLYNLRTVFYDYIYWVPSAPGYVRFSEMVMDGPEKHNLMRTQIEEHSNEGRWNIIRDYIKDPANNLHTVSKCFLAFPLPSGLLTLKLLDAILGALADSDICKVWELPMDGQDVADVCADTLSKRERRDLLGLSFDDAVSMAMRLLYENEVQHPGDYLKARGVVVGV